jgi:hypothetical protein
LTSRAPNFPSGNLTISKVAIRYFKEKKRKKAFLDTKITNRPPTIIPWRGRECINWDIT